jgi:hypothetical protein
MLRGKMHEITLYLLACVSRGTERLKPVPSAAESVSPTLSAAACDGEGLALVEHRSAVKDFYDEDERA